MLCAGFLPSPASPHASKRVMLEQTINPHSFSAVAFNHRCPQQQPTQQPAPKMPQLRSAYSLFTRLQLYMPTCHLAVVAAPL
eukprot:CAMPEP_0202858418 /NCGR_PEP_ID=MMETSP1391-20130828/965_1 /ASSEMBLY_ACC=CAM_ASM_000867 /TAXON_ID=1034604 /ORGANISM="Chlamydomonas leiostraca, Strain SAG 11-49" /LENGTH=81 /DNA_ID=CAMNT_0049537339 /DNA_START=258 /DNA_END=503 /DNA_ORIENTATION=+